MGVDIHIHVLKFNPTTCMWDHLKLFNEVGEVSPFNGRNSELFQALDYYDSDIPSTVICMGNLPADLKGTINTAESERYGYHFQEINYSDLLTYPHICKHSENKETRSSHRTVKHFVKSVSNFIALADPERFVPNSYYKLVYWFDC